MSDDGDRITRQRSKIKSQHLENISHYIDQRKLVKNSASDEELSDTDINQCNRKSTRQIKPESYSKQQRYQVEKVNSKPISKKNKNTQTNQNETVYYIFGIILITTLLVIGCFSNKINSLAAASSTTIEDLQSTFPYIDTSFWFSIQSGIQEIQSYEKPTMFTLLYKEEDEKTVDFFLQELSKYVCCQLGDCSCEPVIFNTTILNNKNYIDDFGNIINDYKNVIERNKIVITKQLSEIPWNVAQAFHYMCDEYNPLVKKSFYISTVKVKSIDSDVVDILRQKWSPLETDKLEPLLTRVTGMTLKFRSG